MGCRLLQWLAIGSLGLALPVMSARSDSPADPPAVLPSVLLLLPPQVPPEAGDAVRAAADLACDHLAQEITTAKLARIVDRQQAEQLLRERERTSDVQRPLLSYDAMIRLEADTTRLAPQATLRVIDLSTGNVLAQHACAWPPNQAGVRAMLECCRGAMAGVTRPVPGKPRVRAIWSQGALANERMRPLAGRLIEVFDEALRRSDRVVPVRHLEAGTAKEESLLLLMGMSRLPGGRQFTPQADATIELRVVEGDGRGKTFPETPVEIGVRIRQGTGYEGDWMTTTGRVRDFDAMIPQAWEKVAGAFRQLQPGTAARLLDDMALRQKQAEAEIELVKKMERIYLSDNLAKRKEELEHIEAAVKLAPTNREAVLLHVRIMAGLGAECRRGTPSSPDGPAGVLCEAARYVAQFHQDGRFCGELCQEAVWVLREPPMYALWSDAAHAAIARLPPMRREMPALTPEIVQGLDATRRVLERGIEDDAPFHYGGALSMMTAVYRGMKLSQVPPAERQAWLEGIAQRCLEKVRSGKMWAEDPRYDWRDCVTLQTWTAELLMEDGEKDRARAILARTIAAMDEKPFVASGPVVMRAVIAATDDAALLARYDAWWRRIEGQRTYMMWFTWPRLGVSPTESLGARTGIHRTSTPLQPVVMTEGTEAFYAPLVEGEGRVYVFKGSASCALQYAAVDAQGRPIGNGIGEYLHDLPRPPETPHVVNGAAYVDGKLCVASLEFGLLVFDTKAKAWKRYGPEQGLPSHYVNQCIPIGGGRLLCTDFRAPCTVDLASGAITLLHTPPARDRLAGASLWLVWRNGQRLMGIDHLGLHADLLGKSPRWIPLVLPKPRGWPTEGKTFDRVESAVEYQGRRFCVCRSGLHEFDPAGKVVRSWPFNSHPLRDPLRSGEVSLCVPGDCPVTGWPNWIAVVDGRLVLLDHHELTVYELSSDTWYGPVEVAFDGPTLPPLVTPHGQLWIARGQHELTCYSINEALAYAREKGAVATTAEYQRRRERLIDDAAPLDRAKFLLALREFPRARAALKKVLDAQPRHPEALLLMGFLHDRLCLNEPEEAIRYYRYAAELENNPPASSRGMYFWACALRDQKNWKRAIEMGDLILQCYPGLQENDKSTIRKFQDECRREQAVKDAGPTPKKPKGTGGGTRASTPAGKGPRPASPPRNRTP